MPLDVKEHYEYVTDAWRELVGDQFHLGYFEAEDMDLFQAVSLLTDKMLEFCDISEDSRIIDVGCGIGGPAFYLNEKFNCAIDGISTSERGIELANAASREKGYEKVKFKVADGVDNGFPDSTFDIAWVMESSHAMHDKKKLIQECYRVLKGNGAMILCDFIRLTKLFSLRSLLYGLANYKRLAYLPQAFGPVDVIPLGSYGDYCVDAGFREVTLIDISKEVAPTARAWKENAIRFRDRDIEKSTFMEEYLQLLINACEILEDIFKKGFMRYGIVWARKE